MKRLRHPCQGSSRGLTLLFFKSGGICEYVVLKTIKLRRGYKLRKSGKRKRLVNFRLTWSVLKLLVRKLPLRVGLRNLSRFKSTSIK